MAEPVFTKISMYITATESISTAYYTNPSHQPVCLYVYPTVIARQRLGKKLTAATNIQAIIRGFLKASFYLQSVPYQRTAGD
jgi:hypothetical protein